MVASPALAHLNIDLQGTHRRVAAFSTEQNPKRCTSTKRSARGRPLHQNIMLVSANGRNAQYADAEISVL